jgi:MoxR-like ATPase
LGACGLGKSQIVKQVADDLDCEFLDVRAVQLDPVDLRGLGYHSRTIRKPELERPNY